MKRRLSSLLLGAMVTLSASAQNPYLPLWEYIPDGEPYVFEDPDCPGKQRVYIYGSHDNLITEYCGRDQVVWSAPVEDLLHWRYDGIIFKSTTDRDGKLLYPNGQGDVLYAPDVTMRYVQRKMSDGTIVTKPEYYLYPNNQAGGRNGQIARSDRPDGPFVVTNWSKDNPAITDGVLRFDPAVFVDDDGRVYGYWGFENSYAAELDPVTMATVKPGTEIVTDMVSGRNQKGVFRFFEASSMRKIEDKYVFVYSRFTEDGEFGLPTSNYTLAYAYGDSPLGPFKYGGTIIDGRARDKDDNGKTIPTAYPYGNTHGSILQVNGQWWVFYHRQTGTDEYSRQAMVAPINVKVERGKGGKVTISEGEYTSEGFKTEGLNPLDKSAAGWACYLTSPKGIRQEYPNMFFTGSYIKPTRRDSTSYEGPYNQKQPYCPVVNNTNGSVVGYKYFNFTNTAKAEQLLLTAHVKPEGIDGTIDVMIDAPKASRGGKVIASFLIKASDAQRISEITAKVNGLKGVKGKHPLFFVFHSTTEDRSICELHDFQFSLLK